METNRKTRFGNVVSNKMDKTVIIEVETLKRHPLYKKTIKRAVKYKAHDEKNECMPGDLVRIVETRPLSRDKRWRVAEIMTRAQALEVKPEAISEISPDETSSTETSPSETSTDEINSNETSS